MSILSYRLMNPKSAHPTYPPFRSPVWLTALWTPQRHRTSCCVLSLILLCSFSVNALPPTVLAESLDSSVSALPFSSFTCLVNPQLLLTQFSKYFFSKLVHLFPSYTYHSLCLKCSPLLFFPNKFLLILQILA